MSAASRPPARAKVSLYPDPDGTAGLCGVKLPGRPGRRSEMAPTFGYRAGDKAVRRGRRD